MSLPTRKNKENISEHKKLLKQTKKLSKETKPLRSTFLKDSHPLKNNHLSCINHSLDESSITVKSPKMKKESKTKLRTRSMNSSECELKHEQKTKKMIPIPLDETCFKLPKSEKTSKAKNSRKQSEYVSYLIQAQRRVMNSLASIDNSRLDNCHQVSNSAPLKNTEIHQLREQMQTLKQRFERLESQPNNINKETIMSIHDTNEKDSETIQLLTETNNYNKMKNRKIFQNCDTRTFEIEKKVQMEVTEKYGSIISEYEKMLNFYKERIQVDQKNVWICKEKEKSAFEENQKLKILIQQKENQLQQRDIRFQASIRQLKEEIGILQKSLNKKNKQLLLKSEESSRMENQMRKKEYQIVSFEQKVYELNQWHNIQMRDQEKHWNDKVKEIISQSQQVNKQLILKIQDFRRQKNYLKEKLRKQRQELEQRKEEFKKEISLKNEQMSSTYLIYTNTLEQLEKLKCKVDLQQKEFSDTKNNLENDLISAKKELKQKQDQIAIHIQYQKLNDTQLLKINKEIVLLRSDLDHKQKNLTQLRTLVDQQSLKLQNSNVQHSNSLEILQTYKQQISEKSNEIEKLKKILIQFTEEVKAIKEELRQNEKYLEEIEMEKEDINRQLIQQRELHNKQIAQQREYYKNRSENQRELIQRQRAQQRESNKTRSEKQRELFQKQRAQQRQLLIRQRELFNQERKSFRKQREELNQCKKDQEEALKKLQGDILEKNNLFQNLSSSLAKKIQQSQQSIHLMNQEKEGLTQQLQMLSIQNRALLEENSSISSQKEVLSKKVQNLNQSIASNSDLVNKMRDNHGNQVANKETQLNEVIKENQKIKTDNFHLTTILSQKTQQITCLKDQITSLTEDSQKKFKQTKDKQQERLINWRAQMQQVKTEVNLRIQEIQKLNNQINQATDHLNQKDKIIAKNLQMIQDLQHKIRRLQNNISDNNNVISSLESQNQQSSVRIQKMTGQLSSLTSKLQQSQISYRQMSQSKQKEIKQVQTIFEQKKRQIQQSLRIKMDKMVSQIQSWERRVKDKDQQINELKQEVQLIPAFKSQIKDLELKLIQSMNVQKNKTIEIQKFEQKNQKLYSDLEASESHSEELRQKIQILQHKISEINSEMTQKTISCEKLTTELSQSKQKHQSMVQRISILKEENQAIISTYNHQLQQRKQIIEDLMREKRQLYQKLHGSNA